MSANSSSVGASVGGVGVCLSSCSRDVIAEDVHAFTFSIGILILLSLYITFILAGEMLCTFVTSSKNSAPKIAWRLLSLVVTIKWVQNVVGITLSGDKLKFRCVVPVIAFVLLPVAVDNLIVVGVIFMLSLSATDS